MRRSLHERERERCVCDPTAPLEENRVEVLSSSQTWKYYNNINNNIYNNVQREVKTRNKEVETRQRAA